MLVAPKDNLPDSPDCSEFIVLKSSGISKESLSITFSKLAVKLSKLPDQFPGAVIFKRTCSLFKISSFPNVANKLDNVPETLRSKPFTVESPHAVF